MSQHPLRVSRKVARRLLLYKQGLLRADGLSAPGLAGQSGLDGTHATVRRLEAVQIDPVMVLAPNQHLVLRQRVAGYDAELLEQLLAEGRIFEYFANARCALPTRDYPLFAPLMRAAAERLPAAYPQAAEAMEHVLARIRAEGPLAARQFSSDKLIGFWDTAQARTKKTSLALELLWQAGEIALSRREGNERFYDLAERVFPQELRRRGEATSPEEAREALALKYCRAFGLFDAGDSRFGWQKWSAAARRAWLADHVATGLLTPVTIEGVERPYWMFTEDTGRLPALADAKVHPDVYLLPPLDNLLWRRERIFDLWEFTYTWEIYVPAAKRRYGSYTMPILEGDALIGRLEARLERKERRLDIAIFELQPGQKLSAARKKRIERALARLAGLVGADTEVRLP